ncbi:MAG TPA: hypothetical protein VHZ95_20610, partial [Polyangiales bacterium]|nr:hypothetical protein [Polyangiales bacterium]
FGLGLGVCALPFVPVMLGPWQAFRQNALLYNSFPSEWGVGLFVSALDGRLRPYALMLSMSALDIGKPLILWCSILLGLTQLAWRPFKRAELCAIAFSCFLVFAPGFGIQYLIYPTAFFAVGTPRTIGLRNVYILGAFALATYYGYWTGTLPPFSDFNHVYDRRMILTGFLAWVVLAQYLLAAAVRVAQVMWRALEPQFE